jgi:hypothetical protein
MKNPAASIQARLLNLSRKEKKDFYDIYDILINQRIDIDSLKEAVRQTFERRQTILPQEPNSSYISDLTMLLLNPLIYFFLPEQNPITYFDMWDQILPSELI